jgi:putative transposase
MADPLVIHRGFRFRLRSNARAEAHLRRWEGCCRKVWNLALAEQQARRNRGEKHAGFGEMCRWITAWRSAPETSYLNEVPVHVLQNVVRALDTSFQRFFKKTGGYPKFKRYGVPCGLTETDVACFAVDSENGRIKFPKLGWLRYRKSRGIDGTPKIVTLTRELTGWYVSVIAEQTKSIPCAATAIGAADRGVNNFLATDSGRLVEPLNAHKESLCRLRRYQRACARKVEAAKVTAGLPKDKPFPKGFRVATSNRLRKAQARVAKIHCQITRQRADFLHKLSTELADKHAVFCLEDLKTKAMTASAAGDTEVPGRKVKQKSGLNRSILDQGWAQWATMLTYKIEWRHGRVILVNPAYTSQKCSACGHIHADNRKGESFRCLECGHTDHADINAAKNILAAGLAVLGAEEKILHTYAGVEDTVQQDRPVKRLPTEELRYAA